MTDQPKPLESPPPTDPNGKQSLPANQYFNGIDVGCNEVDDLMQQVRTLRNKNKNEGSQPSGQDKQDLLRLFDDMVLEFQNMQKVLESQCYLPLEAEKRDPDMVTDHSVLPTAATHTNVLLPKDIISNTDNLQTDPPSSVSESQRDVFMTANKPALGVQRNVKSEHQAPAMSTDSKVQDLPEGDLVAEYEPSSTDDSQLVSPTPQGDKKLCFPGTADDCVKLYEQAKQIKNNLEAREFENQNVHTSFVWRSKPNKKRMDAEAQKWSLWGEKPQTNLRGDVLYGL